MREGFDYLRNAPVKVHFAGFASDTVQLKHAGWDLHIYQEQSYETRYLLAGQRAGTHFIAMLRGFHRELVPSYPMDWGKFCCFDVHALGGSIVLPMFMSGSSVAASAWDTVMDPSMERVESYAIQELVPFGRGRSEELIVDPHDVNALMDRILDLQSPKQKEIREKRRKQAARGQFDGFRQVAQIITLDR